MFQTVPLIAQVPDVVTTSVSKEGKSDTDKEIVQISQVLPGYAPSYAQEYVPTEVEHNLPCQYFFSKLDFLRLTTIPFQLLPTLSLSMYHVTLLWLRLLIARSMKTRTKNWNQGMEKSLQLC